jgi:hypothetical protein
MKTTIALIALIFTSHILMSQVLDTEPVQKKLDAKKEGHTQQKPKKKEKEIKYVERPQHDEKEEIQTLFNKGQANGGYFGLLMNYTTVEKNNAIEIGSRMSLIIGHSFGIGVEGTGFVSDVQYDQDQNEYLKTGGYGGLVLEPIILPKFPVHVSLPILLGGGAIVNAYTENNYANNNRNDDVDGFLIARPGVELEFNITRYFRFCLNTHYRFTQKIGFNNDVISKDGLNGFTYGISFKLGKF